jgi:prevent-host-death family protein
MSMIRAGGRIITSRDFNQNTGEAKKAADEGPVYITDRGQPAYVLLRVEDYEKLAGKPMSLAEALEQKNAPDFEFDPPRMGEIIFRDPDLS